MSNSTNATFPPVPATFSPVANFNALVRTAA